MKNLSPIFKVQNTNTKFNLLNEKEMQNLRGGAEPIKPKSRPRDVFDLEEE